MCVIGDWHTVKKNVIEKYFPTKDFNGTWRTFLSEAPSNLLSIETFMIWHEHDAKSFSLRWISFKSRAGIFNIEGDEKN